MGSSDMAAHDFANQTEPYHVFLFFSKQIHVLSLPPSLLPQATFRLDLGERPLYPSGRSCDPRHTSRRERWLEALFRAQLSPIGPGKGRDASFDGAIGTIQGGRAPGFLNCFASPAMTGLSQVVYSVSQTGENPMTRRARDVLIDILRDEGITHVFGNPRLDRDAAHGRARRRAGHPLRARPSGGDRGRHGRRLGARHGPHRLRQPACDGRPRQRHGRAGRLEGERDAARRHRRPAGHTASDDRAVALGRSRRPRRAGDQMGEGAAPRRRCRPGAAARLRPRAHAAVRPGVSVAADGHPRSGRESARRRRPPRRRGSGLRPTRRGWPRRSRPSIRIGSSSCSATICRRRRAPASSPSPRPAAFRSGARSSRPAPRFRPTIPAGPAC